MRPAVVSLPAAAGVPGWVSRGTGFEIEGCTLKVVQVVLGPLAGSPLIGQRFYQTDIRGGWYGFSSV